MDFTLPATQSQYTISSRFQPVSISNRTRNQRKSSSLTLRSQIFGKLTYSIQSSRQRHPRERPDCVWVSTKSGFDVGLLKNTSLWFRVNKYTSGLTTVKLLSYNGKTIVDPRLTRRRGVRRPGVHGLWSPESGLGPDGHRSARGSMIHRRPSCAFDFQLPIK